MIKKSLVVVLLIVLFQSSYAQIVLQNGSKKIEIEQGNKVKLVRKSPKKMAGLYDYVVHGKHKDHKYGKLIACTHQEIVVQYGLRKHRDTILIADLVAINRYHDDTRFALAFVGGAALAPGIIFIGMAAPGSPIVLGYFVLGIWTYLLIDDLCVYPYRRVDNGKWTLTVNK